MWGSNSRLPDYDTDALMTEPIERAVVINTMAIFTLPYKLFAFL